QQRVPLSRPTLYRLLHTLAVKGLVRASGDPQRFSLDYGVGRLANNWMAGIDPIRAGQPIVQRIRERTNETAALFVPRGPQRLCSVFGEAAFPAAPFRRRERSSPDCFNCATISRAHEASPLCGHRDRGGIIVPELRRERRAV